MPDEKPTQDPAERWDAMERDVLYLLTGDDQPIWSIEDLGRETENPGDIADAVRGLFNAGLIHQTTDGFVFATRAAVRMVQMVGRVV
jgi:hypothetical protein